MKKLPHWCITDHHPAFYDTESATAIEMVAKIYGSMQTMIDEYNQFADEVNKAIDDFMQQTEKNYKAFTLEMSQKFQDFIDVIDLKIKAQDKLIKDRFDAQDKLITERFDEQDQLLTDRFDAQDQLLTERFDAQDQLINNKFADQDQIIADAVNYMKTNIHNTLTSIINQMKADGEFDELFTSYLETVDARVNEKLAGIEAALANAGVQSDWNVNDETNKAHVFNRTHYGQAETSVLLSEALSDELETYGIYSAGNTETTTYILPITGEIFSDIDNITVEVKGTLIHETKVFNVSASLRNILIHKREKLTKSGYLLALNSYAPYKNVLVFGGYGEESTEIKNLNKPIMLYVHPDTNKLHLSITREASFSGSCTFTVIHNKITPDKSLNPIYIGENPLNGHILTYVDGRGVWVKPQSDNYESIDVVELLSTKATLKTDYSDPEFTAEANFDGFKINEEYYVDIDGMMFKNVCSTENYLEVGGSSTCKFTFNDGNLKIIINRNVNAFLVNSGEANIIIKQFKTVKHYSNPVLYSSNGICFSLTVSDNGELSAVPVDTE